MSKNKTWAENELTYLGLLLESGHSYNEIAKLMNRPRSGVAIKGLRLFGGSGYGNMIKHKHLREPVMRYFINHSIEETMEKFKLTASEVKSLFTVGYRDPRLKHLRKDKRNKDKWSTKHYKILLQQSGLVPRKQIAKTIGKGNETSIKERLQKLGVSSKSINGITLSQYRLAFQCEPDFYVATSAGPTRGVHGSSHWKIIPWVYLDQQIKAKKLKAPKLTRKLIESMALFQDWVHEGHTMKNIERIVNG